MMSPTLKSEGDMSPCPPPIDAHGFIRNTRQEQTLVSVCQTQSISKKVRGRGNMQYDFYRETRGYNHQRVALQHHDTPPASYPPTGGWIISL